jgi:predicted nucleic acid-binding protein
MSAFLLDTGPIVALLDRRDPSHTFVRDRINRIAGTPITTGPVITETLFLLQNFPQGPERAVQFLQDSRAVIEDVFDRASLTTAAILMRKYSDLPMDFADASLVITAGRLAVREILTLDERGFRTFCFAGNKPFSLVLQDFR